MSTGISLIIKEFGENKSKQVEGMEKDVQYEEKDDHCCLDKRYFYSF